MIRAVSVSSWQNRWSVPAVDLPSVVASSPIVGVVSAGDPGSSRLVYAMVIGLVVVGIGLILLAVWILRQTRPDLDVLAPLERMGDGDWKKRDPSTQRRMLDEVRPEGAQPLAAEPPPPPIDSDFDEADHEVASFSDLGPGLGGAVPTPTSARADTGDSDDESGQVTDQPVDETPDDPVEASADDAPHESVEEVDEVANESAHEPVDEADDELVAEPNVEFPDEADDELVAEPNVELPDEADDELIVEPDVELLDESDDEPIDESPEQPDEEGVDDQVDDALSDPRG